MIGDPSSCAIRPAISSWRSCSRAEIGRAVRRDALLQGRGAPVLEGRSRGRGDGAVDVLGGALGDAAHDLLGGRVDDLDRGLRRGLHPVAADVELLALDQRRGAWSCRHLLSCSRRRDGMPAASTMFAAVREASAMIVIIGLVPEGVGNAEASPIQTPGRVVQLAARPGDARLRVAPHAAAAHLVGGEHAQAAGAGGDPPHAGDEGVEVVAHPPLRGALPPARASRRAPAATWARTCASTACAMLRRSTWSVISYQGTAMPCSSIVTRPCPWSRMRPTKTAPSRKSRQRRLVLARRPVHGERRGAETGRVLHALDQEPVAVAGVRELVDQPALGRSPPGLHVLAVVAERGRGGVQIQVARRSPGRRSPSAAAARATRVRPRPRPRAARARSRARSPRPRSLHSASTPAALPSSTSTRSARTRRR